MAHSKKEQLHNKISDLLDSLGTNNTRLQLRDQRFPQIEIDLLRKSAIELYDTINQLHIANLQSDKSTENVQEEIKREVKEAPKEPVVEVVNPNPPLEQSLDEVTEPELDDEDEAAELVIDFSSEKEEEIAIPEPEEKEEVAAKPEPKKASPASSKKRLHEKLKSSKISSIKKAISISKRYELQHHLFQDNKALYNKSLEALDAMNTMDEAQEYTSLLAKQLSWDPDNKLVQEFEGYLERRFAE